MGKLRHIVHSLFVAVGLVAIVAVAPAPAVRAETITCSGDLASFLGLKNWDACIKKDDKGVPQIDDVTDIFVIVMTVVEDLIKLAGYMAVGYLVWGGFKYIKSQGDPGEITQSRTIITNALIGLVIVLISVAIVQFVAGSFGADATGGTDGGGGDGGGGGGPEFE